MYPTVMGWTAELLKETEKQEMKMTDFGLEHIYDRYEKLPHEKVEEDIEGGCREWETIPRESDEQGPSKRNETRIFINEWKKIAKEVATSLLKMIKFMQMAPENVRRIDCFKIICDITRKTMGLSQEGDEQMIDDAEKMTQAMCNDEIDDPEWIDIIIELTKAAEERYILNDINEFPTFTLIPEWDNNQNDNAGRIPQVEKQNLNQDNEKEK